MRSNLVSYLCGGLFGYGLLYSGMCNPDRVVMFLDFLGERGWDYSLMGVMGAGVLVNAIVFHLMRKANMKPMLKSNRAEKFYSLISVGKTPANMKIDWKLILGSALFGCGWGLRGLCPGIRIISLIGTST